MEWREGDEKKNEVLLNSLRCPPCLHLESLSFILHAFPFFCLFVLLASCQVCCVSSSMFGKCVALVIHFRFRFSVLTSF